MKPKKWTYSGIKAYYPRLSFDEWLGICRRGDNRQHMPEAVVYYVPGILQGKAARR